MKSRSFITAKETTIRVSEKTAYKIENKSCVAEVKMKDIQRAAKV